MTAVKINPEMIPAMQGIIPSTLASCSEGGITNITYVSQVFYVDEEHVALSWQFFNKTWENIQKNPQMTVMITSADLSKLWKVRILFVEKKTEGDIFNDMEMQLEALSAFIPEVIKFKLLAALICRVIAVEQVR